ncbi:Beta-galactosidase C-terminal domain [Halorhabdus rudnickae]|uniref:Beta-galactosidase C-terminal domain n=1 Tax=Halorhabdus rudnickae TaxID=1775544 RepID=UPI00313D5422
MERDDMTWVGNFTGESVTVDVPEDSDFYPGGATIEAYDIAVTDAAAPTIEIDDSQ